MIESDELIYSRFLEKRSEEDFRILLKRHREGLTLFLYSITGNMDDAEELMLDAFAETAAGAKFFGRSSFKTWLFSIGKNLALMRLRKRRFRTEELSGRNEEALSEPPEFDILRKEQNRQLYEALSLLKEEYRIVLVLLYFEDMTHEEAAKVMGKTKRQIYHLVERGRNALKERLERMGFDYAKY